MATTAKAPKAGDGFKPGTVIEWWTKDTPVINTQYNKVVTPLCANAGMVEHSEECKCAPPPSDPAVIKYREREEYIASLARKKAVKVSTPVKVHRSKKTLSTNPKVIESKKTRTKKRRTIKSAKAKQTRRGRR
jgi:hypothetical protein